MRNLKKFYFLLADAKGSTQHVQKAKIVNQKKDHRQLAVRGNCEILL